MSGRFNPSDLVVFSRVTSAALLVCGYLVAGLWIGKSLVNRGYPGWTFYTAVAVGLAAALLSGFREGRRVLNSIRRGQEKCVRDDKDKN